VVPITRTAPRSRTLKVAIDLADENQVVVDHTDQLFGPQGPVQLDEVADILKRAGGWIVVMSQTRFEPYDPDEDDDEEPWRPSTRYVYARGVVSVSVVMNQVLDDG